MPRRVAPRGVELTTFAFLGVGRAAPLQQPRYIGHACPACLPIAGALPSHFHRGATPPNPNISLATRPATQSRGAQLPHAIGKVHALVRCGEAADTRVGEFGTQVGERRVWRTRRRFDINKPCPFAVLIDTPCAKQRRRCFLTRVEQPTCTARAHKA